MRRLFRPCVQRAESSLSGSGPFPCTVPTNPTSQMPLVSDLARRKKLGYFLPQLAKDAAILEVGCADGWFVRRARDLGWNNIRGLDLVPPADIVGDIRDWQSLGIEPESYDAIIAFELVEHVDCFQEL